MGRYLIGIDNGGIVTEAAGSAHDHPIRLASTA